MEINQKEININSVAFAPNGGWVIIYNNGNSASWSNIPQLTIDTINTLYKKGNALINIAFTPSNGWVLLHKTIDDIFLDMQLKQAEIYGLQMGIRDTGETMRRFINSYIGY